MSGGADPAEPPRELVPELPPIEWAGLSLNPVRQWREVKSVIANYRAFKAQIARENAVLAEIDRDGQES